MRSFIFTSTLLLQFSVLAQSPSDSLITISDSLLTTSSIPKNQISMQIAITDWASPREFINIEYLRYNKHIQSENALLTSNYYFSLGVGPNESSVYFTEHEVRSLNDSTIQRLFMGTADQGYFLKMGMQRQKRLLISPNRLAGFQFTTTLFGAVGYQQGTNQYIKTNFTTTDTLKIENFFNSSGFDGPIPPISGDRTSNYLRIGGGITFGLDFVWDTGDPASNSWSWLPTIAFGGFFSFANLGVNVLMNDSIHLDEDELYLTQPSKVTFSFGAHFGIRATVSF